MGVHIGTSGWAYPTWKPEFYPAKLAAKKFLEYYATRLNSVEVNYTFRQLPSEAMLEGWLGAAGEGFAFSFKAPQRITHFSRLKNCGEAVAALYASLAPVVRAKRLGVVLFQLPPNFKANVELLDEFLAGARVEIVRMAFEFRHASWFEDATFEVLKRHGAALCVAESDELASPDVATAPFRCYRLRKSEYSEAELSGIVDGLREKSASSEGFAYFKHEDSPTGAIHAAEALRRLREG